MFTETTTPLWAIFTLLAGWLLYKWHAEYLAAKYRQNVMNYVVQGAGALVAVAAYSHVKQNMDDLSKSVRVLQTEKYVKQYPLQPVPVKENTDFKKLFEMVDSINKKLENQNNVICVDPTDSEFSYGYDTNSYGSSSSYGTASQSEKSQSDKSIMLDSTPKAKDLNVMSTPGIEKKSLDNIPC